MKRIVLGYSRMVVILLIAVSLLAACSKDDNAAGNDIVKKVELGAMNISLSAVPYKTEAPETRSVWGDEKPVQRVDLGDGLMAEVTLEEDAEAANTRVNIVPIPDGDYTSWTYKDNQRLRGPHTSLSGKVSNNGTVFTPNPGSRLLLDPGTYTFVCHNNTATEVGDNFEFTYGRDVLWGSRENFTISETTDRIDFQMGHIMARVKLNLAAYTSNVTDVSAKILTYTNQPYKVTVATSSGGYFTTASSADKLNTPDFTATTIGVTDTKYPLAKAYACDYQYFMAGTQTNQLFLKFSAGSSYSGIDLSGKQMGLRVNKTLQSYHSYTFRVKLKPILYLFHDGTNGVLAEKGERQPIGIVLTEKTNTTDGLAIALKDAVADMPQYTGSFGPRWDEWSDHLNPNFQSNSQMFPNFSDAVKDMNGYKWTWDAAYSASGVGQKVDKKFTRTGETFERYRYGAFHYAGHFDEEIAAQGITVTGPMVGRKWHLGSVGEWMQLIWLFYRPDAIQGDWSHGLGGYSTNGPLYRKSFNDAGGKYPGEGHMGYHWTSTEINPNTAAHATPYFNGDMFGIEDSGPKSYPEAKTRPFIHF